MKKFNLFLWKKATLFGYKDVTLKTLRIWQRNLKPIGRAKSMCTA